MIELYSPDADTFVVSVEDHDERDITPIVRDAVAYWNTNNDQYSAGYQTRLVFEKNASDPDVLVRYHSSLSCDDARAGGCAPVISSEEDAERSSKPLVVHVCSSRNENMLMTKRTLIHEFGHILSVQHCEGPRSRMGCPVSLHCLCSSYRTAVTSHHVGHSYK